jgi:flagellar protein FlgJ
MKISSDVSSQSATFQEQRRAKLVDASQQFEAAMLQELLKPMQHGQGDWDGDGKNDDSASDTMSSFGTEAVAKAISERGGFGLAKMIVAKVTLKHEKNSEKNTAQY